MTPPTKFTFDGTIQILVKWYLNLWFRDPPFTPDTSQKVPRTVERYVIKVSLEDKSD